MLGANNPSIHYSITPIRKWWGATVLPRALRFKRPLHRCNACNPKKRGRKAELNHRSQACEVLADTGIRVARKWTSIRVARPVFRFGRPACISQHLCSEKWNPVLESHQPLRFCKPPPEVLGQRDRN